MIMVVSTIASATKFVQRGSDNFQCKELKIIVQKSEIKNGESTTFKITAKNEKNEEINARAQSIIYPENKGAVRIIGERIYSISPGNVKINVKCKGFKTQTEIKIK